MKYMSEDLVNQITLDCLLNKKMYGCNVRPKKIKQLNKEERKFYRKRIFNLFKDMITGNIHEDVLPDVKIAYDNFIDSTIQYFKTIDNNDIIQSDYKDEITLLHECSNLTSDMSANLHSNLEADKLLLRSVKMDIPTLDKYVKRTYHNKKEENIILPQQREINLYDPEFKNKGIKKNNITTIYEEDSKKKNDTTK